MKDRGFRQPFQVRKLPKRGSSSLSAAAKKCGLDKTAQTSISPHYLPISTGDPGGQGIPPAVSSQDLSKKGQLEPQRGSGAGPRENHEDQYFPPLYPHGKAHSGTFPHAKLDHSLYSLLRSSKWGEPGCRGLSQGPRRPLSWAQASGCVVLRYRRNRWFFSE